MKIKTWRVTGGFLLLALLFTLAFIWVNSMIVGEISNAASGAVADAIKPAVEPDEQPPVKTFGALVRKAAHMLEFGILGCLLMCLILLFAGGSKRLLREIIGTPLLFAVTDELIQSFAGHTRSLKDVLIDFAGSLAGFLFVGGLYMLVRTVRRDVSWLFWRSCIGTAVYRL